MSACRPYSASRSLATGPMLAMTHFPAAASHSSFRPSRVAISITCTICWALVISAPALIFPVTASAVSYGLQASAQAWLAFAYVSIFSMFLGFFAWYRGLALGGIARVGQVQLLQAFFTVAWSALLLGESITPLTIIALLIVISMIVVIRRAPIRQRRAHREP